MKKLKMIDEPRDERLYHLFFFSFLQICLAINNRGSGERYI